MLRHGSRLVERWLSMVCLASGVLVEGLEVDGAARLSVFLRTHNHAVTPCYWFTYGYRFNDTKEDIAIEPSRLLASVEVLGLACGMRTVWPRGQSLVSEVGHSSSGVVDVRMC